MTNERARLFPERLETERLVLRRWREDDREAVIDIWADPDVWRAIGPGVMGMCFDPGYAAGRFEHHLEHWVQFGFGLWLAQERVSGQVAGWVGAAHPTYVPELAPGVEIGWALRRPFWGLGLAGEGATVAVKTAFAHLVLDEVVSLINPANARSIAVAERLGMTTAMDVRRPDTSEVLRIYRLGR
ncbi:MAG: GNAT family N-acetyltransferase [Actinobacteria bacterium]|nr:MAG: GNAT family N-acetyltransferase [Actinomycetota bacterium]